MTTTDYMPYGITTSWLYTYINILAIYITYTHTYIHTLHTYIRMYVCLRAFIYTYVHTYIRTYIHTYIHTYHIYPNKIGVI